VSDPAYGVLWQPALEQAPRTSQGDAVPAPVVTICREYDFDAAHRLEWHPGACRRLHGHTYTLELSVAGHLDERGVVMDFAELDQVVRSQVLDLLDHHYLNDIIENPTAERIAQWAWHRLADGGLAPAELRLWETRRSSVHLSAPARSGSGA
jgi:6-pyruvoyltetrahydropterin/6-carboxytetrahydropterin synthase